MNNLNKIYFRLSMQTIAIILLFLPMFNRVENNAYISAFSVLLSFLSDNCIKTEYSYFGSLGLSLVLNAVIIITIISILIYLGILIAQLIQNDSDICSLLHKIAASLQTICFAVFGILTTCTISTTLGKGNILFYLKAYIGRENFNQLLSLGKVLNADINSLMDTLNGSPYLDYWGYLKVTPFYFITLLFMFAMTYLTFKSYQRDSI